MGCVSSNLLNNEDDFTQISTSAFTHHIVSLTSTTYGLLNLDPPPAPATTPPPRFTLGSIFPTPLCDPPETINSWELMSGLDTDSFRFLKPNSNFTFKPLKDSTFKQNLKPLDRFETLCPPNGENRVVVYTTTLRGIRETFDACNAVRASIGGFGVSICERDVSMDSGFREELRDLMKGKEKQMVLPRVFVKGRYIGGAEEVMRLVEEGLMGEILNGLPRKKVGDVCDGCGDVRFVPCFSCNGSSKLVMVIKAEELRRMQGRTVVVKCPDCNENGLMLCPICA
ncbi:Glutaredoxin family protein [Euphorbia peplus]|nr:Glutaredoxin family protein [Euphorbia peplus]